MNIAASSDMGPNLKECRAKRTKTAEVECTRRTGWTQNEQKIRWEQTQNELMATSNLRGRKTRTIIIGMIKESKWYFNFIKSSCMGLKPTISGSGSCHSSWRRHWEDLFSPRCQSSAVKVRIRKTRCLNRSKFYK